MEQIVISKLEKRHIKEASKLVQPLHETMVNKRQDIFLQSEEDWEKYFEERLLDKEWVLLVATIEDVVVGVCTAEIKRCGDDLQTKARTILFIDYISVNPKYRRNKVGTKLLDEVKNIAKENNFQTVELNVWGFNKEAMKFYDSNDMRPKRIVYEYLIDKEK